MFVLVVFWYVSVFCMFCNYCTCFPTWFLTRFCSVTSRGFPWVPVDSRGIPWVVFQIRGLCGVQRTVCGAWRVACCAWSATCGVWRVACGVWVVRSGRVGCWGVKKEWGLGRKYQPWKYYVEFLSREAFPNTSPLCRTCCGRSRGPSTPPYSFRPPLDVPFPLHPCMVLSVCLVMGVIWCKCNIKKGVAYAVVS